MGDARRRKAAGTYPTTQEWTDGEYFDRLASFVFGRCPTCAVKRPGDWHATMLTKHPIHSDLTDEQRQEAQDAVDGYLAEIWDMCPDHRRATVMSSHRLPGEAKTDPRDYPDVCNRRRNLCWSASINSSPLLGGRFTCVVTWIRGDQDSGHGAHH